MKCAFIVASAPIVKKLGGGFIEDEGDGEKVTTYPQERISTEIDTIYRDENGEPVDHATANIYLTALELNCPDILLDRLKEEGHIDKSLDVRDFHPLYYTTEKKIMISKTPRFTKEDIFMEISLANH